jgi:uncharacterized protein YxeA
MNISKNKIVLVVIIILVILIALFVGFKKINFGQKIFSLTATVLSVDVEKNILTVQPQGTEREINVIISEGTKLTKLEASFDSDNPLAPGTEFTPAQVTIIISGFQPGDEVLIKSSDNIYGKNTINNVEFINVLP